IEGIPHANVGVYGLPPVDGTMLRGELDTLLASIAGRAERWKAFPIRTWWPRSVTASPRALLVGDAAGVDPLMGEGISFAVEYGQLAAEALERAHAIGDWS